eukprot:UN20012
MLLIFNFSGQKSEEYIVVDDVERQTINNQIKAKLHNLRLGLVIP